MTTFFRKFIFIVPKNLNYLIGLDVYAGNIHERVLNYIHLGSCSYISDVFLFMDNHNSNYKEVIMITLDHFLGSTVSLVTGLVPVGVISRLLLQAYPFLSPCISIS